jgi:hypothetical protein
VANKIRTWQWIIITASLLTGCSRATPTPSAAGDDSYAPDAVFQTFLAANGGAAVFGPALEPAHRSGQRARQTFLNAQLIYDPAMPQGAQVSLASLGDSLGLAEPPVAPPADSSARYFASTGHSLYGGFVTAFDQIGGERVVGPPISEVEFVGGRIFQSFANLALYREASDPPSQVRLSALGLASTPDRRLDSRYVLPPGLRARPFGLFLDQYGAEQVFGRPLSDPYPASDGALEQAYERAVLFAPADSPGEVRLRPLGATIGPASLPVVASSETVGLYFPQTGHYVLWAFADFFRSHGGEKVLGLPLDEAAPIKGVLTQRFENAILEYHYELPPQLAVQLAPLGKSYQKESGAAPTPHPAVLPTPTPELAACTGPVTILTHTAYPILPAGAAQEISLQIMGENGSPISGLTPMVVVHGPHGDAYPAAPSTNVDGKSQFSVRVEDLAPGEIVNYEIVVAADSCTGYAMDQFAGGAASP